VKEVLVVCKRILPNHKKEVKKKIWGLGSGAKVRALSVLTSRDCGPTELGPLPRFGAVFARLGLLDPKDYIVSAVGEWI
jgi:hypothetical protein